MESPRTSRRSPKKPRRYQSDEEIAIEKSTPRAKPDPTVKTQSNALNILGQEFRKAFALRRQRAKLLAVRKAAEDALRPPEEVKKEIVILNTAIFPKAHKVDTRVWGKPLWKRFVSAYQHCVKESIPVHATTLETLMHVTDMPKTSVRGYLKKYEKMKHIGMTDEEITEGKKEEKVVEEAPKEPPKPPPKRNFVNFGMYSLCGRLGVDAARKELKKSKAALTLLPLPIHQGEWFLDSEKDFELPYDAGYEIVKQDYQQYLRHNTDRAPWREIKKNVYLNHKTKKPSADEVSICSCKLERGKSRMGCGDDCVNRLMLIECDREHCPCGDKCSNTRLQDQQWKAVEEYSNDKGMGLRAAEDIKAGDFIIEYLGEVIDNDAADDRLADYGHERHHYIMSRTANDSIDASRKGSQARFINHSCEPNCSAQKWSVLGETCVGIFANRDIDKGEEITYDYQFVRVGDERKRCMCGSKKCRGFLGAPKVQEKKTTNKKKRLTRAERTERNKRRLLLDGPDANKELVKKVRAMHLLLLRNVRTVAARRPRQVVTPVDREAQRRAEQQSLREQRARQREEDADKAFVAMMTARGLPVPPEYHKRIAAAAQMADYASGAAATASADGSVAGSPRRKRKRGDQIANGANGHGHGMGNGEVEAVAVPEEGEEEDEAEGFDSASAGSEEGGPPKRANGHARPKKKARR